MAASTADRRWRDELGKHLRAASTSSITWWDEGQLRRDGWAGELDSALDRADVALALVSADFLGGPLVARAGMDRRLSALADRGRLCVVLPVAPSPWQENFYLGRLPPASERPLAELSQTAASAALSEVAERVAAAVRGPIALPAVRERAAGGVDRPAAGGAAHRGADRGAGGARRGDPQSGGVGGGGDRAGGHGQVGAGGAVALALGAVLPRGRGGLRLVVRGRGRRRRRAGRGGRPGVPGRAAERTLCERSPGARGRGRDGRGGGGGRGG